MTAATRTRTPVRNAPGILRQTGPRGTRYVLWYRDPDRRQRSKTFRTLDAAKRFKRQTETALDRGSLIRRGCGTRPLEPGHHLIGMAAEDDTAQPTVDN